MQRRKPRYVVWEFHHRCAIEKKISNIYTNNERVLCITSCVIRHIEVPSVLIATRYWVFLFLSFSCTKVLPSELTCIFHNYIYLHTSQYFFLGMIKACVAFRINTRHDVTTKLYERNTFGRINPQETGNLHVSSWNMFVLILPLKTHLLCLNPCLSFWEGILPCPTTVSSIKPFWFLERNIVAIKILSKALESFRKVQTIK